MTDNRTKNALRNIGFGSLNRLVTLILPFASRTLVLYLLGVSYLGIGTLFSSILSFLSLAELGLGSAIVYSMYKPITENDIELVSALLNYYRKLFRIIGSIILAMGTILAYAIPHLMKGDAPGDINVYILYYIYLVNSVISYFFSGYRQSLLLSHQRTDIASNVATIVNLIVQLGQMLALFITRNFYIYAFVPIFGTMLSNYATAVITRKRYPLIRCKGTIPNEIRTVILAKISGLFGTKLNSIVVHSADVIVISAYLGLTMTAQYGNYYFVMNAICGFIGVLYTSLTAGIGNKLVTDSIDENYKLFKNLSFINAWIVGWCSVCLLCLYEPFMKIWAGEELQLGTGFTLLMVGYFFIYEIQRTIFTFKDAAGLWHKDKKRPYVSMIINLIGNLILVQIIGIYGIILSTIIAFLLSLPWANHVLFSNLFHKPANTNIIKVIWHFIITVATAGVTFLVCTFCGEGIVGLIERLIICCLIPNVIFYLLFKNSVEFTYMCNIIIKIVRY